MDFASRLKRIIFLICLILSFNQIILISASEISISPTSLSFEGKIDSDICKEVTLSSDREIDPVSLWSTRDSRKLEDYSENKEVKTNFLQNGKIISICISSKRAGDYYGVFLFKESSSNFGIGCWAKVSISGQNQDSSNINSPITGMVVFDSDKNSKLNSKKLFLLTEPFILLAIFLFLLLRRRNKNL